MSEEKVIDKIRKLLSLAENGGATEHEAELAFQQAQRLMAKHSIDEARMALAGVRASEAIIKHVVHLGARDEIKRAKLLLIGAIARDNNCRIVDATSFDQVWIVGHETEAQFVEMLSATVLMQYAVERQRAWGRYSGPESRYKWVNAFAWGYAKRIGQRLKEAQEQVVAEQDDAPGTALVLADRAGLVKSWMDENLSLRQKRSQAVSLSIHAMEQGASAANRADLSGGRNNVGGKSAKALS